MHTATPPVPMHLPPVLTEIAAASLAAVRESVDVHAPGYAPPLSARQHATLGEPVQAAAPRPAARQWVDGGVYHMIEWRDIERRAEDLRAEGREVGLKWIGNGYVRLRYTTTPPERFHAAEGAECGGEADAAHLTAERVGGA